MIDEGVFYVRIREYGGPAEADDAERAVRATLAGLGEAMPRAARYMLAAELPRSLRDVMLVHRERHAIDASELAAAIKRRTNVSFERARTEVRSICIALGEQLPTDVRDKVLRSLSPSIVQLFESAPVSLTG